MTQKHFDIDGIEYTVTVETFYPGSPGQLFGPPENCYPEEPWDMDLCDEVEVDDDTLVDLGTFLARYALEWTGGDLGKAEDAVKGEIYNDLWEQEYDGP